MKIAVASGKGGTGKTTVSVNLYYFIAKYWNNNVKLVDCDVEEPNDVVFFASPVKTDQNEVFQKIPKIDTDQCTFCRKCADWCEFNAITIVKNRSFASINPDLCHSCGACIEACSFGAITEHPQPLGTISHFETGFGKGLLEGRLKVGSSMQTTLIKEVKKASFNMSEMIIYDSPPGTSCSVVETVADADYIILITEPTPFGLHDLKIMIKLLITMQKKFGVVVNKAGLGSKEIYAFLTKNNIEILGKIPFSKKYASNYATGKVLKDIPIEIEKIYREIIEKIYREIIEKLELKIVLS